MFLVCGETLITDKTEVHQPILRELYNIFATLTLPLNQENVAIKRKPTEKCDLALCNDDNKSGLPNHCLSLTAGRVITEV